MRRLWRWALALLLLLAAIQLVPYGHAHSNPAPTREAHFRSAAEQRLFDGACADCHSDHTRWRWYASVAPASWLVQRDVDGGRRKLDLSRWNRSQAEPQEVERVLRKGGMPPLQYKLIHSDARLSTAARARLAAGFRELFSSSPPG